MHEHHSFTWLSLIPGLRALPIHLSTSLVIVGVLIFCTTVARAKLMRAMSQPDGGIIPDSKLTFFNFFEIVAEKLYGMTENILEDQAKIHFPLIGSLFVYIVVSNMIGLLPGFLPPTDNMNTTLALGVFVFIYYNVVGVAANGFGYLKHFLGPVIWISPLMVVLELISHMIRPFSLGLRLRGNIMGDHIVLGIFTDLVPYVLPVVFYALGLFVAVVQAFVFSLLTMVYISMSTAHDH